MLEACTFQTSKDFRQRYQGTIGQYTSSGKKMFVWIEEVNSEKVVFKDTNGNVFYAANDQGTTFEFTQVPFGWFNSERGPLLFSRKPARQWQRGISTNNTEILNWEMQRQAVTLDIVSDAMSSFKRPWKMGDNWALNKFFCIIGPSIYFMDNIIGSVDGDTITLINNDVAQELTDAIHRGNYTYKIKYANSL